MTGSMGGHRPMINDKTLNEKYGRMDIMTRQPLYDINADRLLNIEKYLEYTVTNYPVQKREIELSKYDELVNAYRELAVSDNDKDVDWAYSDDDLNISNYLWKLNY